MIARLRGLRASTHCWSPYAPAIHTTAVLAIGFERASPHTPPGIDIMLASDRVDVLLKDEALPLSAATHINARRVRVTREALAASELHPFLHGARRADDNPLRLVFWRRVGAQCRARVEGSMTTVAECIATINAAQAKRSVEPTGERLRAFYSSAQWRRRRFAYLASLRPEQRRCALLPTPWANGRNSRGGAFYVLNEIVGLVPGERIELPTNGLQNRCSTAELTRQLMLFQSVS